MTLTREELHAVRQTDMQIEGLKDRRRRLERESLESLQKPERRLEALEALNLDSDALLDINDSAAIIHSREAIRLLTEGREAGRAFQLTLPI